MSESPASVAAQSAETTIKKIPLPTLETFEPEKLSAAAAAYAIAVRKVQEADKAVAKIQLEQIAREERLALINEVLSRQQDPIHIWCAIYKEGLTGIIETTEIPGYWMKEGVAQQVTIYENTSKEQTVFYTEYSVNISPSGAGPWGDLMWSDAMGDAAIAYNLAMEPGHLKWRPLWRYGILTTDGGGNICNLTLNEHLSREEQDAKGDLDLDEKRDLSGVPISYPPCHGVVFEAGDEVLVLFEGQDRNRPKVIGFRRKPKQCPRTWREVTITST